PSRRARDSSDRASPRVLRHRRARDRSQRARDFVDRRPRLYNQCRRDSESWHASCPVERRHRQEDLSGRSVPAELKRKDSSSDGTQRTQAFGGSLPPLTFRRYGPGTKAPPQTLRGSGYGAVVAAGDQAAADVQARAGGGSEPGDGGEPAARGGTGGDDGDRAPGGRQGGAGAAPRREARRATGGKGT